MVVASVRLGKGSQASSLQTGFEQSMVEQIGPEGKVADRHQFRLLQETTDNWRYLSFYSRFEQVAALILTVLVSCVIVVAMLDLVIAVARDLFIGGLAPVDHAVFQAIFGMIMTVLIAMEFNHTILSILHRKKSIVQLRTVILIALLAMARKFIIIDITALAPMTIIGLAFAVLALGCVYWLVREQDQREGAEVIEPSAAP
jgi:uncharacterized membrane protein (DUF373 family)